MTPKTIINAARAGILAAGYHAISTTQQPGHTLVRISNGKRRKTFGPGKTLQTWCDAYEYVSGKPWHNLLKFRRRAMLPQRGTEIEITGTEQAQEHTINQLDRNRRLISAVYVRRGNTTRTYAEVI